MNPVPIRNSNFTYTAPKGMEGECADLHMRVDNHSGERVITSAWSPTPDEVARIASGQPVWLHVYGNGHPVVALSVPNDD